MRERACHLSSWSFTLDTIGLGPNVDVELLGELAALGGGSFAHVHENASSRTPATDLI